MEDIQVSDAERIAATKTGFVSGGQKCQTEVIASKFATEFIRGLLVEKYCKEKYIPTNEE
ncbi:MAG: hypothetical protein ACK5MD_05305 [Flavobacteriales bacterium]